MKRPNQCLCFSGSPGQMCGSTGGVVVASGVTLKWPLHCPPLSSMIIPSLLQLRILSQLVVNGRAGEALPGAHFFSSPSGSVRIDFPSSVQYLPGIFQTIPWLLLKRPGTCKNVCEWERMWKFRVFRKTEAQRILPAVRIDSKRQLFGDSLTEFLGSGCLI